MKKKSKLEQEIEEILNVSEPKPTEGSFSKSIRRNILLFKTPHFGHLRVISPLAAVILGIILISTGVLTGGFKNIISSLLTWGGLVSFILAYFLFLLRGNTPRDKKWRGRSVSQ